MFVNIVHLPKIKEGKEAEFRQCFVDSTAYMPGIVGSSAASCCSRARAEITSRL